MPFLPVGWNDESLNLPDEMVNLWIFTFRLTLSGCRPHTSSVWPWSGAPKVRLYDTFLGSLCHSPPWMKNQHGLNEEKKHIGKKIVSHVLSACDVTRVVSLCTNNLSRRVCESGEKACFIIYSLSRSSSNGLTLRIFILSILFPRWTGIVPFVWTDVMSQGSYAIWTQHCRGYLLSLAVLSDQPYNHIQFCLCFYGRC